MAIGVDDAVAHVVSRVTTGAQHNVSVVDSVGLVLAQELHARSDVPASPVSIMDGWAVRAADLEAGGAVRLRVAGESAAGHPARAAVAPGTCVRVSTGGVIPDGADAVVAQEDAAREDDVVIIECARLAEFGPGRFIRPAGSDVRTGEVLVTAGARLGPGDMALLASGGHGEVPIRTRPRVAILCNGDELVAPGIAPGPGQVVSTNGPMLAAQVRESGGEPVLLPNAADDPGSVSELLRRALGHDIVVTSGGISVGPHDLVLDALQAAGCEVVFRKVALRPGKPTTFGMVGATPVFALPGNPASTFVTFELFVREAICAWLGTSARRPVRSVTLADDVRGARDREHLVRVALEGEMAHPLRTQASGNLRSIAGADALVRIPAGVRELLAGSVVQARLLPPTWPS